MIIEIGNFRLTSNEDRFHVSEMRPTPQKDGKTVIREVKLGNDMRFQSAIQYVVDRNINDQELTVSVGQYVEMYKKEREKITNILK